MTGTAPSSSPSSESTNQRRTPPPSPSGALAGALEAGTHYSPLESLARYDGPKLSIISDMNRLPFSLHNLVPDLPTRLLPGTGHWLMMDCPEPFNHMVDEFLAGVDGKG